MTTILTGHAQAIVESSDDAILSKDTNAVITSWNPGAERLYGYSAEEAIGRSVAMLIPPHRANEERRILDKVLEGERVQHYETERVRKDGVQVYVSLSVAPIYSLDGEEIVGASVIARNVTEQRRARERAQSLQRLTESLSRELSRERVAELIAQDAVPAVGADAATIGLLDDAGEKLELIAARGYSEEGLSAWTSFPLAADLPMSVAARIGEPVWSSTSDDLKQRFPLLAQSEFRFEALAAVPLTVDGTTFGAAAFSFTHPHEFSVEERAFMLAATQQAANALYRSTLHEAERRSRERLGFIARASEFLGSTLDPEEIMETLASVAVPEIADWCAVHLVEDGSVRQVAVNHVDPARVEFVRELQERYPPDPDSPRGVHTVIRSGDPELYPTIPDELLSEAAVDEEHLRMLRELGMRSAIVVPLVAHGRGLGAITLVTAESGVRYTDEDLSFVHELARHAALAIDNANRFRREHEAALALQRALLPQQLPEMPNLQLAARYLPAGSGIEAGGDWFDAIELGDGRVDLVIGDVSGRGIPAASVMGRLRTAIGAYALDRMGPADIAVRIDRLLADMVGQDMATMLFVRVDPASGALEYVRAGHLPALVRSPDGSVRLLDGAGSPPLGLMVASQRPSTTDELEPGSLLLLCTDGLVERRGEVIDAGIARLQRAFEDCTEASEGCLDELIDAVKTDAAADDVALLLVRVGEAKD
jgi:PAS domain S-box-containing protein